MARKTAGVTIQEMTAVVRDDAGSVLLVTVIMLLLITILGISGINTATTDIQITKNYNIHKQNLALADAAVNRAVSRISYGQSTEADTWVNDISDLYTAGTKYFKAGANWATLADTPVINQINVAEVIADWDAGIPAINPTTLPGAANTQYVIYINTNSTDGNAVVIARSRANSGDVIIEAGFNTQ